MSAAELQIIVLAADAETANVRANNAGDDAAAAGDTGVRQAPLPLMLSRATAVAGHAVTVVLGARAGELAPALGRLPVTLVVDRNWEEGAAASVRAGIQSLAGSCNGALLVKASQSDVTTANLQRMVDTWRRNARAIVAAPSGGGHDLPAVFPRSEFPALLSLRGSQGPQLLLRRPGVPVVSVP
jgi:CTP:molybdopterin cytidylyltransferase MocA